MKKLKEQILDTMEKELVKLDLSEMFIFKGHKSLKIKFDKRSRLI